MGFAHHRRDTLWLRAELLLASGWGGFGRLWEVFHGETGRMGCCGAYAEWSAQEKPDKNRRRGELRSAARGTEIGRVDHCRSSEATAVTATGARSRGRCPPLSGPLSAASILLARRPWVPGSKDHPQLVHWSVPCFMQLLHWLVRRPGGLSGVASQPPVQHSIRCWPVDMPAAGEQDSLPGGCAHGCLPPARGSLLRGQFCRTQQGSLYVLACEALHAVHANHLAHILTRKSTCPM